MILKVGVGGIPGFAKNQEIRAAVKRFQTGGKKVRCWAESFSEHEYVGLAACDEILAPPTAYIQFTGFASRSMHIKNALDKLGIRPNIHKIQDYKSAAELVLRADMSEPVRENRTWILDDLWAMMMDALEHDRGLDETAVVALMEHAYFTAEEAVEGGLVDRLVYWDEIESELKGEDDDTLRTVSSGRYAERYTFCTAGSPGAAGRVRPFRRTT